MPKKKDMSEDAYRTLRQAEALLQSTALGEDIDFNKLLEGSTYGLLTPEMEDVLKKYVKGKVVYDLGAGDLGYSHKLLELGAGHIIAVDKVLPKKRPSKNSRISAFSCYFNEFEKIAPPGPNTDDIAFVSWPANHVMPGLIELVSKFNTVIYLGKCTDGACCAWPPFFHKLYLRPLLEQVPHRRNTLLVYGKTDERLAREHRQLCLEERAGGDHTKQYNYEDKHE